MTRNAIVPSTGSLNLSLIIKDETRSFGHDFDFLPGHVIYSAKSIEYRWIFSFFIFLIFILFLPLFVAIKPRLRPRTDCDNAVFFFDSPMLIC